MRSNKKFINNLRLAARTENLSPPILSIASIIGPEIYGSIKGRIKDWKEKNLLQRHLFGFMRNADFLVGPEALEKTIEDDWHKREYSPIERMITSIVQIFDKRPELVGNLDTTDIKFVRSIVAIGGPIPNVFSAWITREKDSFDKKIINPSLAPDLPYKINLVPDSRCKEKSFYERAKIEPEPNWSIMNDKGENVYIPEYYMKDKGPIYMRDYAMIIKVKSINPVGRIEGKKNMVLAGCHECGTVAAGMALNEVKILKKLWDTVGDMDFQAIIVTNIEDNEPEDIELLDVKKL